MPMGDSGGRSAGNRTGMGARRRNTLRERQGIDPPWDEMYPAFPEPLKRVTWIVLCLILTLIALLVGVMAVR